MGFLHEHTSEKCTSLAFLHHVQLLYTLCTLKVNVLDKPWLHPHIYLCKKILKMISFHSRAKHLTTTTANTQNVWFSRLERLI